RSLKPAEKAAAIAAAAAGRRGSGSGSFASAVDASTGVCPDPEAMLHRRASNGGGSSANGVVRAALFGVFDGHGGCRAAEFAIHVMPEAVKQHPAYPNDPRAVLMDAFTATD